MKKLYIGIDTPKDLNTVALAFAGNEQPELYGKVSADLGTFQATFRRIMKNYDLSKEDIALCYEAGRRPNGKVDAGTTAHPLSVISALCTC